MDMNSISKNGNLGCIYHHTGQLHVGMKNAANGHQERMPYSRFRYTEIKGKNNCVLTNIW